MPKKEFKIGEMFQCGLIKLRCEKVTSFKCCDGCFFHISCLKCISGEIAGSCAGYAREDKTDVIFVKVED